MILSHPAWVCGLKQACTSAEARPPLSHPAWVCGLKLPDKEHRVVILRHTLRGCVD